MLRRLIAILLIACLAAPAIAMPQHCMPPPAKMAEADCAHGSNETGRKAPISQIAVHGCIGCIVPLTSIGSLPLSLTQPEPVPLARRFLPLAGTPGQPDTPPPRH